MMKSAIVLTGLFVCSSTFGQSLSDHTNAITQQRPISARDGVMSSGRLYGVLKYTNLTIQLTETPARDAFAYLKTVLGVTIIGRYSDDRIGDGLDPDTPITIDVVNQPALNVLEEMLAQCEDFAPVTWQLRRGYIEVGTKSRLASPAAQEIRTYPVRDILYDPPMFNNAMGIDIEAALSQGRPGGAGGGGSGGGFGSGGGAGGSGGSGGNGGGIFEPMGEDPDRKTETERAQDLIDLIEEVVEPDQWSKTGGEFTIRYFQGSLIVRAPDYVHRQLGGYPRAIRPTAADPAD